VGQLASSTIGMIKKNEVLMKIKDEIIKHRRELESASGNRFVKSLLKVINDNISSEEDWSVFEQNFDQAHDDFLRALRTTYPSLTPKDLRFCAYLRMNLSSKEIASLLNITVRGVEIRRYRLRKKLGLDHEKNLVEFMMEM
jgi:DNA-binding CsgD family transcriptional regulator